jgi:hypothetical protein
LIIRAPKVGPFSRTFLGGLLARTASWPAPRKKSIPYAIIHLSMLSRLSGLLSHGGAAATAADDSEERRERVASGAGEGGGKRKRVRDAGQEVCGTKQTKPTPRSSAMEKRMCAYRATPNRDTRARIERALSQRLYLVDRQVDQQQQTFAVLGSTGNIYHVMISRTPSCSCPDHAKGNLCKHILFVFLRVLRVATSNPVIWQKALLTSELGEIFEKAPAVLTHTPLASAAVRSTYSQVTGTSTDLVDEEASQVQRKPVTGPCPICFEDMHERACNVTGDDAAMRASEETVWCTTCGQSVHDVCLKEWAGHCKRSPGAAGATTCPYCRSPWALLGTRDAAGGSASVRRVAGGYLNLGSLQPGTNTEDHHAFSWY